MSRTKAQERCRASCRRSNDPSYRLQKRASNIRLQKIKMNERDHCLQQQLVSSQCGPSTSDSCMSFCYTVLPLS
jgi:hypothetical protein